MYFYAFLYGDSLAANYAYGISGGIKVQGWIQRSTMNQVGNRFGQKGRTAFGNALAKGIVFTNAATSPNYVGWANRRLSARSANSARKDCCE